MTNMLYLWKMYLSEFRLPSMFFAATLRAKLADYFQQRQIPIKIALITKTVAEETNTKYAQGGIATVWDTADSF